jgi:hypothetical protein
MLEEAADILVYDLLPISAFHVAVSSVILPLTRGAYCPLQGHSPRSSNTD